MINELQNLIIEDLLDSEFVPNVNEAYAWTAERMNEGRVGSFFHRMLNKVDWEKVEQEVESQLPNAHGYFEFTPKKIQSGYDIIEYITLQWGIEVKSFKRKAGKFILVIDTTDRALLKSITGLIKKI